MLDQEQIEASVTIAPRSQAVETMPDRAGAAVATEIGGRFLVRYLVASQLNEFLEGSTDRDHWVTPTAIAPEVVVSWLALFAPKVARQHVLVLDVAKIDVVRGPAWIRGGQGIEYYLPGGFPKDAVVDVGVLVVTCTMPPEFETLSEHAALLKRWSSQPSQLLGDLTVEGARADFGERHGSWFLRLSWTTENLTRTAELALTNATVVPDGVAESAVVTVRASASSEERFVAETVYEARRGVRRLTSDDLAGWLRTAVERASNLSNRELSQPYLLGTPETTV